MADAVRASRRAQMPRTTVRMVRAVLLFVAGVAITLTATLHASLGFDLGITTAVLGLLGLSHLVEWPRESPRTATTLLLGIAALVTAIALPFIGSASGFAVALASWSLVSALLEFVGAASGRRPDAMLIGGLGILLAVLVLLVQHDPVAILGFFGGYVVIAGVFLGISAFDARHADLARDADQA